MAVTKGARNLPTPTLLVGNATNGDASLTKQRDGVWLAACAPLRLLVVGGLFVVAAFVINLYFVSQLSSLGITLADSEGAGHPVVVEVKNPQSDGLQVGDVIVAFRSATGEVISVSGDTLKKSPLDEAKTFEEYNDILLEQGRLYSAYIKPGVSVELADGRIVPLAVVAYTPMQNLPARYWLVNLLGAIVLLIGVSVWSFRRGEAATRLLVLSGVGYWLAAHFGSMFLFRELAMPADWLYILSAGNSFGGMLLTYSVLGLLWYYPGRLGPRNAALWIYLAMGVLLVNELVQIINWPLHTFGLQYMLVFFLGLVLAFFQWRRAKNNPVARASLLWFLLSILLSTGLIVALYFLPLILNGSPLVAPAVTYYLLLMLYIGLTLGVMRFQLFRLEAWWLKAWVCYFSGMFVLIVDVALAYVLNVEFLEGLSLVVLSIVWLYFPLRQWCWERFIVSPRKRLEHFLPSFITSFYAAVSGDNLDARWCAFLSSIYESLGVKQIKLLSEQSRLTDNGLTLQVPAITKGETIVLTGRNQSTRLFSLEDVKTTDSLLSVAQKMATLKQAHEQGVHDERERIKRDLHDDVGAKLLTLMHRAATPSDGEIAKSALCSLRDTIYSLEEKSSLSVGDALADIRTEASERLEFAGINLAWNQSGDAIPGMLGYLQSINLVRIIREVVSNVVVHAYARRVVVCVEASHTDINITVSDDGLSSDVKQWVWGVGTNSIKRRVSELDGHVSWYSNDKTGLIGGSGITFKLVFPIKKERV